MNQENLSPLFKITILTCLLLIEKSSCVDPHFEACEPKSCGILKNISYPFWIQGQTESYCGFPGFFNITCNNDLPVLHIPDNDYIIHQIYYNNQSLRVSNYAVLDTNDQCFPPIKNVTLGEQFEYVYNNISIYHNITLLSKCSSPLPEDLLRYNIGCGEDWVLVLFGNDKNLSAALEKCDTEIVAPIELYSENEISDGNYKGILRRGFELEWRASDCSACSKTGGRCGFNSSSLHFRCFCPDRPHAWHCTPGRNKTTLILATVIPGAGVPIICLVLFIFWRRHKLAGSSYFLSRNTSSDPSSKADLEGGSVYFGVPVFSYSELEEATENFDPSKELGDGGFGTVYYGKLRDGREVAVKRLYENNYKRVEQFMNEISILTCLHHRNLVTLYGCTSRHSRELILVYEYISNGTVADHLHGDRANPFSLTWPIRMNIAIETATALAYLHATEIVHRDVKTNNILLDSNFCVKVADFGLSRLFPINVTHVSTAPQGTPGYVDPEYHQCYQLTNKSDVYSFGVVLIELISSLPAVDISRHRHEINLANLAINRIQKGAFNELVDPNLGFDSDDSVKRMTTSVAELSFRCLQHEKEMRPTMVEVLEVLKEIQADQEGKDGNSVDFKFQPPLSPENDEVVLLKNNLPPPSPDTVTHTWVSSTSTTSNTSG